MSMAARLHISAAAVHGPVAAPAPTPAPDPAPTAPTPPDGAPAIPASKPGPRLSSEQRALLRKLIAQYGDIRAVKAVIAADYPDFPIPSDSYLYQLRKQLAKATDGALAADLLELRRQQLGQGLAVVAHRVAELERMYGQLLELEAAESAPQRRLAIMRDRRAVLEQIARETTRALPPTLQQPAAEPALQAADAALLVDAPADLSSAPEVETTREVLEMLVADLQAAQPGSPPDLVLYDPGLHDPIAQLWQLTALPGHESCAHSAEAGEVDDG
jgi:hypothetical protein